MADAKQLTDAGYRRTSRKFGMLARVDRPDWKEHMAKEHAPWSFEEGMKWVNGLGDGAASHYRRVYSNDRIEIDPKIALQVPSSDHDPVGYIPKEGR